MGKWRRPRPINRHASTKAAGFWGPRRSVLDLWLCLEAKPECALGPGATVGVLGTGVPKLACVRPAVWLKWWPCTAHLHQRQTQHPREGPSLAGRTTQDFFRNGLARQAHEEAERSRQGTSRGAHDASHDDRDQAGARRAPAYAVSLFPLWCKGAKHRPRYQEKATVSVQQDQGQRNGRMEVTVEPRTASPSESLAVEDQL